MGRADEGIPMKRILNKPEAEVFEGVTDEDIQNEVLEDIGEKKMQLEATNGATKVLLSQRGEDRSGFGVTM